VTGPTATQGCDHVAVAGWQGSQFGRDLLSCDVVENMLQWSHAGGFSVDASVWIAASDRRGLERLVYHLPKVQQPDGRTLYCRSVKPSFHYRLLSSMAMYNVPFFALPSFAKGLREWFITDLQTHLPLVSLLEVTAPRPA
jgi:hypothetical protein